MHKSALLIASILLLFTRSGIGQVCFSSAYVPGYLANRVQPNNAGNYLIQAGNSVVEIAPANLGIQSFNLPGDFHALIEVADGYLIGGYSTIGTSAFSTFALETGKITKQGQILWYKNNIEQAGDNSGEVRCTGFGVISDKTNFISSRRKIYRIDTTGHAFDTIDVHTAGMDEFTFVTRATNGDFVALAQKYMANNDWQAYQVRFDSALNFQSSKLVPFAGTNYSSSLSVQEVLPNGEWLLLAFQATDNFGNGHPEIIQLDALGDLQWTQLPALECFMGSPCAYIASLVRVGDFIWRMEVTTDGHPRIVRCSTTGEPLGHVDLGPYGSMYGVLYDAVPGSTPNEVLLVGYERTGTPGINYQTSSIAIWLQCENTTSYLDILMTTTAVVSPNPVQHSFSVQLPAAAEYRLLLHDALGRQWKNDSFTSESTIIDCAALPTGLYFLSIEAKGGVKYRNVVVVAH